MRREPDWLLLGPHVSSVRRTGPYERVDWVILGKTHARERGKTYEETGAAAATMSMRDGRL